MFTLIFGRAFFGTKLASVLLVVIVINMFCFSSWCLGPSSVKWRVPRAASLQSDAEKVRSFQLCQDIPKWCSHFSAARQRMHRVGVIFSTLRTPGEIQNQGCSHWNCLLHENIGWQHDFSSGHEPKIMPVLMAAAVIAICGKK